MEAEQALREAAVRAEALSDLTLEDRARAFLGPKPEGVPESGYLSALISVVHTAEQLAAIAKEYEPKPLTETTTVTAAEVTTRPPGGQYL